MNSNGAQAMSKRTLYIQPLNRHIVWSNPLTGHRTSAVERLKPDLSFGKTKMESSLSPEVLLEVAIKRGIVTRGGWVKLEVENGSWHFTDIWPVAMEKLKAKETINLQV
jgi:hypothetical protein